MVDVSFINPFSDEGRQIVREYGNINAIYEENGDLIDLVTYSRSQDISDEEEPFSGVLARTATIQKGR